MENKFTADPRDTAEGFVVASVDSHPSTKNC